MMGFEPTTKAKTYVLPNQSLPHLGLFYFDTTKLQIFFHICKLKSVKIYTFLSTYKGEKIPLLSQAMEFRLEPEYN